MQGVTTALVAFIFFCVIFPERVRNRPQFYAGLALVCGIILLDALAYMINGTEVKAFRVFAYFAMAFLQVAAILILFMAAGGLSWQELRTDMARSYEVIRRGGEEKEVIIPLTGGKPKPRRAGGGVSDSDTVDEDVPRQRIAIDDPMPDSAVPPPGAGMIEETTHPGYTPSPPAPPKRPAGDSPIPLE